MVRGSINFGDMFDAIIVLSDIEESTSIDDYEYLISLQKIRKEIMCLHYKSVRHDTCPDAGTDPDKPTGTYQDVQSFHDLFEKDVVKITSLIYDHHINHGGYLWQNYSDMYNRLGYKLNLLSEKTMNNATQCTTRAIEIIKESMKPHQETIDRLKDSNNTRDSLPYITSLKFISSAEALINQIESGKTKVDTVNVGDWMVWERSEELNFLPENIVLCTKYFMRGTDKLSLVSKGASIQRREGIEMQFKQYEG